MALTVFLTLTDPRGEEFLWKLALTRTPDPNRSTRRGIFLKLASPRTPDVSDLGVICGGGISRGFYPRTILNRSEGTTSMATCLSYSSIIGQA